MTTEGQGISRRSFLSGAALAGVAAAGAGLAGCAPTYNTPDGEETGSSAASSGGTVGFDGTGVMPWLGDEPEIADSDVTEELTADVVVVGLGCAGVPAARAAVEAGASVMQCTSCHTDAEVPDGWITAEEEDELTLYTEDE